ncbi:MAG: dethiobiotin synthase [Phycisphaerales bacterium]|nr:dethiobiotin synthase [Phycisphaerales bacterium]
MPEPLANSFDLPPRAKPGLFITATDTNVGKTVITCAIADVLVRLGLRVGVCKPFATGARTEREGLVSDDAQALAYFSQFDPAIGGLPMVTPILERLPLAPAVAMERSGRSLDLQPVRRSLAAIDRGCDVVLMEGVGGVMVPVDPGDPQRTVLDLIASADYPVLVVCRADLGTLNHTALTVEALRRAGCRIAGLVMNFYNPDDPDPAMQTNRDWLARMNRLPVLATVPRVSEREMNVAEGVLHDEVRAAVALTDWRLYAKAPRRR